MLREKVLHMKVKNEEYKKYCIEIYRLTFKAETRKDAYLKACKWYAKNILSNNELQGIQCEYIKDEQSPSITICLYATVMEENVYARTCQICKETHNLFFMNDSYNCNRCNINAYRSRITQSIGVKVGYYKKLLMESGVI